MYQTKNGNQKCTLLGAVLGVFFFAGGFSSSDEESSELDDFVF